MDITHVVTLVHGTWARNAPWTQPDSALAKHLLDHFGKTLKIERIDWPAHNTHSSREQGAKILRKKLWDNLESYSGAKQYVVSHSHGGMVAMYALQDEAIRKVVSGVACLGTPFIIARKRELPVHLTDIYATTIVLLGFLLIAILERAGVSPGWAKLLALTSGIALLCVLIKLQRYAQRLLPRFEIPQIDPEKLLIVRTRGDEASSSLLFAQFIGQAGMLIVSWLMSRHNRLKSAIGRWANKKSLMCGWLIGGIALFFGLFSLLLFPIEMKGLPAVLLTALLMFISIMILIGTPLFILLGQRAWVEGIAALALPAVLWPIAAIVSMILLPSLGWQIALVGILLEASVETTPIGTYKVHHIERPIAQTTDRAPSLLSHSAVYDLPETFEKICQWIATTSGCPSIPQTNRKSQPD